MLQKLPTAEPSRSDLLNEYTGLCFQEKSRNAARILSHVSYAVFYLRYLLAVSQFLEKSPALTGLKTRATEISRCITKSLSSIS